MAGSSVREMSVEERERMPALSRAACLYTEI
jgi:hypothetical protein